MATRVASLQKGYKGFSRPQPTIMLALLRRQKNSRFQHFQPQSHYFPIVLTQDPLTKREEGRRRLENIQRLMGRRAGEQEVPPETMTASAIEGHRATTTTTASGAATGNSGKQHHYYDDDRLMIFAMDDVDNALDPENVLRVHVPTRTSTATHRIPWSVPWRGVPHCLTLHLGREQFVSRVRLQSACVAVRSRHEVWLEEEAQPFTQAMMATMVGAFEGPMADNQWIEIDLLPRAAVEHLLTTRVTIRTVFFMASDGPMIITGMSSVGWYAARVDALHVHHPVNDDS